MKVAIRADASSLIGSGHIMRCKALAEELCRRDAEVRFFCRAHSGSLIPLLEGVGHRVTALPAPQAPSTQVVQGYAAWLGVTQDEDATQTIEALEGFSPEWLVVDHYALDQKWEDQVRPHAGQILVIDDLANRPHNCDLLLDQNWFGGNTERRYDDLVPETCQRLLGPRYALLHPLFGKLRKHLLPRDGEIRRALVFFGGVDSHNQTVKALQAFNDPELRDIVVDVVIGEANPRGAEIEKLVAAHANAILHRQLPSLADLMSKADLMLGAGGTTTWERCCLGLPSIVVTASENQRSFTAALAEMGVQLGLGLAADVEIEDWVEAVRALRSNPAQVRAFAAASSKVTDGLGVYRLATVLEKQPPSLRMRRATQEDESLLLEWANDLAVRRHAFSPQPISADTHHDWFQRKLADCNCLLLIGEDTYGLPVGQVRFDCHAGEALIDVSVDRVLRGRGLGEMLLRRGLDMLRSEGRTERPVAEVLKENQDSRHLFLRSGFQSVPGRNDCDRFVLAE